MTKKIQYIYISAFLLSSDGFDCDERIAKALRGSHDLIAKYAGADGGKILAILYMTKN